MCTTANQNEESSRTILSGEGTLGFSLWKTDWIVTIHRHNHFLWKKRSDVSKLLIVISPACGIVILLAFFIKGEILFFSKELLY